MSELQRLDEKVRQATSEGSRRAILRRNKRNKLLALLVARHRYHGETEGNIGQLVSNSTHKNKNQIAEELLTTVSFHGLRSLGRLY